MTGDVPAGSYALYCTIPSPDGTSHAAKGMIIPGKNIVRLSNKGDSSTRSTSSSLAQGSDLTTPLPGSGRVRAGRPRCAFSQVSP
jgi:hypothetical protein